MKRLIELCLVLAAVTVHAQPTVEIAPMGKAPITGPAKGDARVEALFFMNDIQQFKLIVHNEDLDASGPHQKPDLPKGWLSAVQLRFEKSDGTVQISPVASLHVEDMRDLDTSTPVNATATFRNGKTGHVATVRQIPPLAPGTYKVLAILRYTLAGQSRSFSRCPDHSR